MSMVEQKPSGISVQRLLPLIGIGIAAVLGFIYLREYLTFEALGENREALIAWRDANYIVAVLVYMAIYIAVVAFSLPGALIMTLTGGFLFGLFPGVLYIVTAATLGAIAIFMAAKLGLGDALTSPSRRSSGLCRARRFTLGSVRAWARCSPAVRPPLWGSSGSRRSWAPSSGFVFWQPYPSSSSFSAKVTYNGTYQG